MSWVTSLRLPPVSDTASGMPCASVIRWCLEPGRARSTGLGPVLGRPSPPAHASCQSLPGTSPARPRRSVRPAAPRAAAATPRLPANRAAAARRSSPTRTPVAAAGTPTGSPCTGQTESRTGPSGHPAASARDGQRGAGRRAAEARSDPITRPARSTVAAGPSSQGSSTTTPPPVFPPVILLAVLSPPANLLTDLTSGLRPTPPGVIPDYTPGTGALGTAGALPWDHLIYAYLVESTGAVDVLGEVVRRFMEIG